MPRPRPTPPPPPTRPQDHGFLVPGNPHLAPVQASSTPLLFSPTHPQDYGFLVPRNTHDTVKLRFDRGLVEVRVGAAGVGRLGW